ncbi:hypothetical protein [Taibaiella chishuiensis]|uniref:Restriction endonuclease n=1 Tax=Taibaiella chishuiensis TaxID=1434707 RepID=A0A2P8D1G0_9BACT|nr:hypothetical protein [Taibaiella chishuiensis]PSK91041.1 hypothetical protein B0I18_10651 [Taibaiella chishuiensis]
MIEIINCYARIDLSSQDFTRVIKGMNDAGYKSAIWQSKLTLLSTVGITKLNTDVLDWLSYYNIQGRDSFVYRADIFLEHTDLVYVINRGSGWTGESKVEIGVIGVHIGGASKLLAKYANSFINALKTNIDGRKVRHMNLRWYKLSQNNKIDSKVSFEKGFTYASLQEDEVKGAVLLSDAQNREILLRIAETGSIKKIDFKGEKMDFYLEKIEMLTNLGLVDKMYTVTCRKKSTPIAMIRSMDELTLSSKDILSCPHCARSFEDELLQESFSLTTMGRKLTLSSHWMTILVTQVLVENGIPEKSIIWSLEVDGEEVDCVVQFKDKIWILELKDRNFEAGDAHPLAYRSIKYKADKTIIITTGKVSKNARKVFEDLSTRRGEKNGHPLYIEGLSLLKSSVATLIKNEALLHVREKTKEISKAAYIELSPVFSKLFGSYTLEHKGEFKEGVNIFRY